MVLLCPVNIVKLIDVNDMYKMVLMCLGGIRLKQCVGKFRVFITVPNTSTQTQPKVTIRRFFVLFYFFIHVTALDVFPDVLFQKNYMYYT